MRYAAHEFMPCFIWMYCMDAMVSLVNFIAVGNHFEAQSQEFGSSFTHEHTLKENFEIIHNGTNRFIQFKASSLVEPVRPSGSGLPVIGLPCTLSGIDWVISVRFFVGETVMTPILGVNSGVGKNLPDFF